MGALLAGLLGGVSELSLYGIHLHHRRVYRWLLAGCAAGGVTSAVFGWLFPSVLPSGQMVRGVTTYGIRLLLVADDSGVRSDVVYALSIAVAFVMAMVLTSVVRVSHAVARHQDADGLGRRERTPRIWRVGLTRPCRMWSLRKILHRGLP